MRAIDRPWGRVAPGWAVLGAGVVAWAISLRPIGPADLTDVGLISALPPTWWVAVALVAAAFAIACVGERPDTPLGVASIVAATFLLYGTPAIIEALPRFNTVYVHLGLIEAIARTGQLYPDLDARFSWPLFFAAAAVLTEVSGVDLLDIAAWVPTLTTLVALPAMWMLARAFTEDRRLILLSSWVLVVANWVGQDYLSPQGFNFVIYLWFIALVAWFFGREGPSWEPLRRRLVRLLGEPAPSPRVGAPDQPPAARAGMLVAIVAMVAVSVASHQLTPFAMIGASLALVVVGRTRLVSMPILVSVLAGLWLVFPGFTFVAGHFGSLVADIGDPTGTAGSGVVARVRGSEGHLFVVLERIAYTLIFWGIAAVGGLRRLRAGHWDLAAVVLAGYPFGLIVLQSYGGEIFLRVFLFALPPMSFFAAAAIAPVVRLRPVVNAAILVAVTLAMTAGFVVARYGNEAADLVTPAELAAVDRMYTAVPPGSVVALLNYNAPVRYRSFEAYEYVTLRTPAGGLRADSIARQLDGVRGDSEAFVFMTPAQAALAQLLGVTAPELDAVRADLAASPLFRAEFDTEGGTLYRYVPGGQP